MEVAASNRHGPNSEIPNSQLVRNILGYLAAHHPHIKPDDVAGLPDNLLDWDRLVEVDFVRDWQTSIDRMQQDSLECVRVSGQQRAEQLAGPRTLAVLFEAAKTSEEGFSALQCAAITIGNLIEDAISRSHPELARVIQLQINSFWNASANRALREGGYGGGAICAVLPEYAPRAPELGDDPVD